jgi:hypothetical protein
MLLSNSVDALMIEYDCPFAGGERRRGREKALASERGSL